MEEAARAWCAYERGDNPDDDVWSVVKHGWMKRAEEWLVPLIAAAEQRGREAALREAADECGVNVGDEDDEWWRGYRQAQREKCRELSERADQEGL